MTVINQKVAGAAVATILTGGDMTPTVPGAGQTMAVGDATGYPPTGRFTIVMDRGQPSEEKILITSRSGATFTVAQRGYDGTTGQSHTNNQATVEHPLAAAVVQALIDHVDGVEVNPHSGVLLNNAAHDIEARHQFGAALGTPVTPTALTPNIAGAAGTGNNPSREDHVHNVPAASAGSITNANAEGSSGSFARADHNHAYGALSVGTAAIANDAITNAKIGAAAIDDENFFSSGLSPIIVQGTDPGAVGANRIWFNTATDKRAWLRRNAGNTAWEVLDAYDHIAYTPTYPTMPAVGNAVHYARYIRKGGVVIANGFFRVGSTTNFATMTNLAISLPTNAQAKDLDSFAVGGEFFGMGGARCQIGATSYAGIGVIANAGPAKALDRFHFIVTAGSSSAWRDTVPGAWNTGDEFEWFIEYEPATLEDANWV